MCWIGGIATMQSEKQTFQACRRSATGLNDSLETPDREDCCFMNQDGPMQEWETWKIKEKRKPVCMPLNGHELQYKPNADPKRPNAQPLASGLILLEATAII